MHWFRRLLQKEKSEEELNSELQFHLERQIAGNLAKGMTPDEARRTANLSFGGVESVKEQAREIRRANWLDTLRQDLLFAARLLRKNPGFTLAAVVTLALGIGANTAIFSIVNSSLLRPLPFKDSSRILSITTKTTMFPLFNLGNSWPAFQLMRAQAPALEESAVYAESEMNMSGQGTPEQLTVTAVSDGFFEELGVTAQQGRLLTAGDQKPGQNQAAVLSDSLWRTHFGVDPSVIGRTLVLDKKPYVIVGVAARNFSFPEKSEAWTPVAITPDIVNNTTYFMFQMIAKIRGRERIEQLNAQLATIAQRLVKRNPALSGGLSFNAQPLLETRVRDSRTAYLVLLVASTLVLLIACANLASLLLARGSARVREMAVRAALGASRGRLLRQGLVESCLIALVGGGIGMLLAAGGVRLFRLIAPPDTPRLNEIGVDGTLLLFSLATALAAGILFGLAPARRASRMDPNEALKQGTRGGTAAARTAPQSRLGNVLVVVEVALAFILLIGSALMTRTLYNLLHQNPGFRTDHLLTFDLPNALGPTPDDQFLAKSVQRVQQVLEQLRAVPGVEAVTASDHAVLDGMAMEQAGFQVEGATSPKEGETRAAHARLVYPSYFRTLAIPLVRGREFTERDVKGTPPVAVVNEAMAREYWGTLDVLGKHLSYSQDKNHKPIWVEIVGVAADNRDFQIREESMPEYYSSMLQESDGSANVLVRTLANPDALAKTISSKIWSALPDQPIAHVTTLSRSISESVGNERLRSVLLAVFAGVGFALALVGVYGVISYSVARRIQELGIRMALGATRGAVLQMILRQGLLLVVLGVAAGAGGALALASVITAQFYGVKPTDPITFVGAAAAVIIVAALACGIPARRAMRVDPMVALRYE